MSNTEPEREREAWSYQDLADAYSISTRTVRRLVARGQLTAIRIGNAVRVTETSRRAWVASLPLQGGERVAA